MARLPVSAALIFIAIAIFYGISRAGNSMPSIRRIAGLDAIEEAIGRATETGKPVFYTTGMADITGDYAAVTFAALRYLAMQPALSQGTRLT